MHPEPSQLPNLPAVATRVIAGAAVQTVNARDIHAYLKVGKDFSTWIKERIATFAFVEGEDYVTFEDLSSPDLGNSKSRAQKTIEYFLTLDMGKEIGMVDRSERGREIRRHFLDCEKIAKGINRGAAQASPVLARPVTTASALRDFKAYKAFGKLIGLDQNQTILRANRATLRSCGIDLLAAMDNPLLEAPHQESLMTVTELGMRLGGFKARQTNIALTDHGFQTCTRTTKGDLDYQATELGKPYSRMVDQDKAGHSGAPVMQLRWLTSVIEPLRAAMAQPPDKAS